MTREKAIKVLDMFLHKQCDLERTKCAYDENTVWDAVRVARDCLENTKPEIGITGHEAWALIAPILYQDLVMKRSNPENEIGMDVYLRTYFALKEYDENREE